MKKLLTCLFLVAVLVLLIIPANAANHEKDRPLQATDIEIVKKVTTKGKPQGGKPSKVAATGIIGENCAGTRYAIVIGISDYPGDSSDLSYCDDDANSFYEVLKNTYGFDPGNIKSFIDDRAKRSAISDAINEFKNTLRDCDELVFFFSGHGAKGKAKDGDSESVDESIVIWSNEGNFDYLWDGELKTLFEGFPTSRIVFVFDSCLSGGMNDLSAQGRIINMACSESGVSYEFTSLEHGQFTYYFAIEGMGNVRADTTPHDGQVTDEEAFDYAVANCVYQKPAISDSFENDLLP